MISTITSKGQLTIPKKVRQKLKLHSGDKIEFILEDSGHCQIVPVKSPLSKLKGIVPKPDKPISLKAIQDAIEGIEP
ncbi:type II toxin-antitoxin system PrlF family antitoxin [bacterium]|nr:type II toxin-antitoxin system PrlF family antitoxin [bacterium]